MILHLTFETGRSTCYRVDYATISQDGAFFGHTYGREELNYIQGRVGHLFSMKVGSLLGEDRASLGANTLLCKEVPEKAVVKQATVYDNGHPIYTYEVAR